MARREVIEISCDRCNRTETQNKSEVRTGEEPEITIKMGNVKVEYPDLCRRCRTSVKNYFDHIRMVRPDEVKENGHLTLRPSGLTKRD